MDCFDFWDLFWLFLTSNPWSVLLPLTRRREAALLY